MKKTIIYTIVGLLVVILGVSIISCSTNPLRQSSEQIREDILELTPMGTNFYEAAGILERVKLDENWERMSVDYGRGIPMGELGRVGTSVGEHSIRATIGNYSNFFMTDVVVFWVFDKDLELIEVFVEKIINGL